MAYFLGVDAGGTKTEFLLADEARELGRVRTGSIKRLRRDADSAARHLATALTDLSASTGISMQSIDRCCVGTSGETVPLVAEWIRDSFRPLVGGEFILVGDVEIALDAAFEGGRGVLVLAGTGSNVAGRGNDGVIVTSGGWGPALADEGSGHFLGILGLRRAFRALDEERFTTLLQAFLDHWSLSALPELIEYANANPAPDFSELAPLVVECAAEGDAVAEEVIRYSSAELADVAALAIEKIRRREQTAAAKISGRAAVAADTPSDEFLPPPVAYAGSILEKVIPAREALMAPLRRAYPNISFAEKPADPVLGALWRARQSR